METHNCRKSRKHGIIVASSWTVTHGFCVMNRDDVDPDEIHQGGIPILQHSQARPNTRDFEGSYSNEEREYCVATILVVGVWAKRR